MTKNVFNKYTLGVVTLSATFVFALVAFITIIDLFLMGFVTMKVWNWFVPQATNLGALTFLQAVGLRLVYRCFNYSSPRLDPDVNSAKQIKHGITVLTSMLVGPFFMLFIAFLVKSAM